MRPHALHDAVTDHRRTGFNHPAAWCICACFGVLCWLVYHLQWSPSWASSSSPQHIALWLCNALLLGLWSVPQLSKFSAVLLVLLAINLFGIAPQGALLAQAANDALLMALGVLGLSVAAREAGALGWLLSHGYRLARARHGLACGVALSLVFALLPSPHHAHTWMRVWQQLPEQLTSAYRSVGLSSQLAARLICLAAHPVNIVLMALLPQSGTDRFLPWHWALHMWPLAAVALCVSAWAARHTGLTSLAGHPPAQGVPQHSISRTQLNLFAVVIAVLCLGVLLQPLHGLSTGLLVVLALVAMFALRTLNAQQFHQGVDWSLLVILLVLPGLLVCLSAAMPPLSWGWDITQVPWLALPVTLALRCCLPSASVATLSLIFALTWSTQHGFDLLGLAMPLVAAVHISDFLLQRATTAHKVGARLRTLFLDPVTWGSLLVFYLWCIWYGW